MLEKLKLKRNRLKGLIFFLFAFTLAIFTFSVGKSATDSQKSKYLKYNPKYNKKLDFRDVEGFSMDKLLESLKYEKVSIMLVKKQPNSNVKIKTYALTNGIFVEESMVSGKPFKEEDFAKDGNDVIATSAVKEEELNISFQDKDGNAVEKRLNKVGESYDRDGYITLSYPLYKEIFGEVDLNDNSLSLVMAGYEYELNNAQKAIQKQIKELDLEGYVKMNDYVPFNTSKDSSMTKAILALIIGVTIVNSVGISTIWVESRKKEIIMRKIMGATDFKISLLFFGELFIICLISIIIALLAQFLLKTATGGVVMNLDLSMNLSNIIYSILLIGAMSLCIAVPFLSDLKKVEPIEIIRED